MNLNRLSSALKHQTPGLLKSNVKSHDCHRFAVRAFSTQPEDDKKKQSQLEKQRKFWKREFLRPRGIENYNYVYREVDPSLPRAQWYMKKAKYLAEDTFAFGKDIWRKDEEAIIFKTAGNMRRQLDRFYLFLSMLEQFVVKSKNALVGGVVHTVHGMKDFGRDSSWLLRQKIKTEQFETDSYKKNRRSRKVYEDVIKMIPFSMFLLIPGAELALPLWLKIFPNSMPSQFLSEDDKLTKFNSRQQKQEIAA